MPRAKWWLEKAAKQDFALAQYKLARMYSKGEGVEQDLHRAREWYERAAKQDFALAKTILDKVFKKKEKKNKSFLKKCLNIFLD